HVHHRTSHSGQPRQVDENNREIAKMDQETLKFQKDQFDITTAQQEAGFFVSEAFGKVQNAAQDSLDGLVSWAETSYAREENQFSKSHGLGSTNNDSDLDFQSFVRDSVDTSKAERENDTFT